MEWRTAGDWLDTLKHGPAGPLVRPVAAWTGRWAVRTPWLATVACALWNLHRNRWGFDLASSAHWRRAWGDFLAGRMVIDTVDEVLQWGSLLAAAAFAVTTAGWVTDAARNMVRVLTRPSRDDTPLADDYDPAVITSPLPGARHSIPKIALASLSQFGISDDALQADTEAMAAQLTGLAEVAVADAYRSTAAVSEAGQPAAAGDGETGGRREAEAPSAPINPASDAVVPDARQAEITPAVSDASDQAILRLYGTLAQGGWTSALLRDVAVASAARPDDRADLVLAGEARIYVLVLVAVPTGYRASAVDERGYWLLDSGGQTHQVTSPVVRAAVLTDAIDAALQRTGLNDAPIVAPVVVVTDGVLRADREHEQLWENNDVVLCSEPPGIITATARPRRLTTVLAADRPSGATLNLLRSALDAS